LSVSSPSAGWRRRSDDGVVLDDGVVERGFSDGKSELVVPVVLRLHLLGHLDQLGDDLGGGQGPVGVAVDRLVELLGEAS